MLGWRSRLRIRRISCRSSMVLHWFAKAVPEIVCSASSMPYAASPDYGSSAVEADL
jgi:hypothetical protein